MIRPLTICNAVLGRYYMQMTLTSYGEGPSLWIFTDELIAVYDVDMNGGSVALFEHTSGNLVVDCVLTSELDCVPVTRWESEALHCDTAVKYHAVCVCG